MYTKKELTTERRDRGKNKRQKEIRKKKGLAAVLLGRLQTKEKLSTIQKRRGKL